MFESWNHASSCKHASSLLVRSLPPERRRRAGSAAPAGYCCCCCCCCLHAVGGVLGAAVGSTAPPDEHDGERRHVGVGLYWATFAAVLAVGVLGASLGWFGRIAAFDLIVYLPLLQLAALVVGFAVVEFYPRPLRRRAGRKLLAIGTGIVVGSVVGLLIMIAVVML